MDRFRVGFDIGGTFTDFVLLDQVTGRIALHKCLTTPADPSQGALEGLLELLDSHGVSLAHVAQLVHGTTLVTNAIIERQGAVTGLLTTRGFKDILELATEQRYDIYDLFLRFPDPLVPRNLIGEVSERISRDGDVLVAIDFPEVEFEVRRLLDLGIESLAVCFLHSYKNPTHERLVRDLVVRAFPTLTVSISSDVVPEIREYERATTTTANAYVQPLMTRYLHRLEDELRRRGFRGHFFLMQSSGGVASPATARTFPIRFLESGPAGGAVAAALFGHRAGLDDVISFDMGGTTAKACLIQNGAADLSPVMEAARVHRFKRGSGLPVKAPVIDMIEIGAGGGSIAHIDTLGLLKVGPHSAGAEPGPACYGLGGREPTVTDANLLLGYLNPSYFLGGRLELHVEAADRAVRSVAEPLGLTSTEAAWGIYNIVTENMAAAARAHVVEKGRDPRRYALVAFGGAGPAHAARVARILGVSEVIVPPGSGAASALGLLAAPASCELVTSSPGTLAGLDWTSVNTLLDDMERRGRATLAEAGVASDDVTVARRAEMRLVGQIHDIVVDLPDGSLHGGSVPPIEATFEKEYARLYTHVYRGAEIQVINWRVSCSGSAPQIDPSGRVDDPAVGVGPKGMRRVYVPETGGFEEVRVYDRYTLRSGDQMLGPCIVEERESTTLVLAGDVLRVDEHLNLRLLVNTDSVLQPLMPEGTSVERAIDRIEADPIGLEIVWNRLIGIVEECWLTVWRTAFSLIIGHAQDFGCELLDAQGNSLGHSPRSMPVFNLTLPVAVKEILKRFPADTLRPGDILCTNDPWICAGHLYDIAVVTPVFLREKLVAIVGTIGHVADIGGTQDSLNAREIYDEGLQIPPMKLSRGGEINQDLLDLVAANVRNSEQVLGDIHAMISANTSAARRLLEFMDEYGLADLEALATVIQNRAERATREAIRHLPRGSYEGEIATDGMGRPVRLPVRINIEGDDLSVDWAGAPPQFDRGGSNCTLTYAAAHTAYPLKCILTPSVPSNVGCFRPFHVSAPEETILNCSRPVAVNTRTRTGWYLAPAIFNALAQAAPERVQAFTGLPGVLYVYGQLDSGGVFHDHLLNGGGQGASAHADGKSGLLWPTSAANTSVELFEARAPVLIMAKEYLVDSGGAGRHRGGLGHVVRLKKLRDDGLILTINLMPDAVLTRPPGLFGGQSGAPGGARVGSLSDSGQSRGDLGIGGLITISTTDQIAELHMAGGGGYGLALDRPADEVQLDLSRGYVSPQACLRDYGCIVGPDGKVDDGATAAYRGALRAHTPVSAG